MAGDSLENPPMNEPLTGRSNVKRIYFSAAVLLASAAACTASVHTAQPSSSPTSIPVARVLKTRTHARVLTWDSKGLELVSLDTGRSTLLVRASVRNGDYWIFEHASGGVVAHGLVGGSGGGAMETNTWFIPTGPSPRPRLLGRSTDALADPAGGVWLIDFPNNTGGYGTGSMRLVSTSGRTLRRTTTTVSQRPVAVIGRGSFVTEFDRSSSTSSHVQIRIYDAFALRFTRDLTSSEGDAVFVRMQGSNVVWRDGGCASDCKEHLINIETGLRRDRLLSVAAISPDGRHLASELGSDERHTLFVDGRPIEASDDAARGVEWSPDGQWLFFIRPDLKHFGVWHLGSTAAQVVPIRFGYLEEWTVFDQR
jgi:WD40 repeat protein